MSTNVHPDWYVDSSHKNIRDCQRNNVVVGKNAKTSVLRKRSTHQSVPKDCEDADEEQEEKRHNHLRVDVVACARRTIHHDRCYLVRLPVS